MSEYTKILGDDVDVEEAKSMAMKGIESGKRIASEKFAALQKYAEEGGYSWKVLGLCAGSLMILNGALCVLLELTSLSPLKALLNVYLVCFGAIAVILEYKNQTLSKEYLALLRREAHFLYLPYGRGAFYVFCGTILCAKGGIFSFISGLFVISIGVVLFYSNRSAQQQLAKIKDEQFDSQRVAALFQQHDKDRDGCLSTAELAPLCQELGSPLDYNSLESALLLLDANGDGKIQYEEFIAWYRADAM